jgi:hypothetical protein
MKLNLLLMKKIFLTSLVSCSLILAAFAQQVGPNLSWDNPSHDFGEIKEEGGPVTYKFEFTNTGNQPLVITNVKPSCGCTSSDYTKEPVGPGAKGYVSATYNPQGRPGPFNKSITVTSNSEQATSTIRFTGKVLEKPKTKADLYPRQVGTLNLTTNHLSMMKVKNTEVKTDSIGMANLSDKPITVSFRNVPGYITVKAVPETLKPNQTGSIVVSYDGKKKNDWGFLMDKVTMALNGETNNNNFQLSISATIEEDFSQYSEGDLAKAPKIVFENTDYNFGTIKEGEKAAYAFVYKNEGKKDLIIRKTTTSCGCTVINSKKDVLKPGEKSEIKVTFNSAGRSKRQNKTITLVTNDPLNPQVMLRISGDVIPANENQVQEKNADQNQNKNQ